MMDIFLFGSGYSSTHFIQALRAHPDAHIRSVTGTTRSAKQAAWLREQNITPVLFDAEQGFSAQLLDELHQATHIVSSIAPLTASANDSAEHWDPVLHLMPEGLKFYAPDLRFVSYLSTLSVYGDYQGAWVDENSPLRPLSAHSKARVMAEKQWLKQAETHQLACAVLRIAGIYGPVFQDQSRNALSNIKLGRTQRLIKKDHVFNRIHVEDIGGALAHLAVKDQGGIYNLADDLPAPAHDVVTEAALLLGVSLPPATDYDNAELSPMARSFYQECKRASNAALKASGYQLRFPDYRAGLRALFDQGEGR